MKLYIMRHGESEAGEREDPTRGLTDAGKAQARLMGKWLRQQVPGKTIVLDSNMRRSRQTAKRVARKLGVDRVRAQHGYLDPDAKPEDAFNEIVRAGKAADAKAVIAVSHGPLVQELVGMATGATPAMIHFPHAAVAHIDSDTDVLHWLVTPDVAARDEDEREMVASDSAEVSAEESELIESLEEVTDLLESLRLKPHAPVLARGRKKLTGMLNRRWRRQKRAILAHLKPWMQTHSVTEADDAANARLRDAVGTQLNAVAALHAEPTDSEMNAYRDAIRTVSLGAIGNVSVQLGIEIARAQGQQFVEQYLQEHALSKLSSDINATTKERIANALADAYESGGTFSEGVAAIENAFAEMTASRADMIARTELNDAYNQAMLESGRQVSGAKKQWNTDGEACPECQANEEQGPIGINDTFPSGDDAPTAHPRCDCALSIVVP